MLKALYKFGIEKLLKNELVKMALIAAVQEVFEHAPDMIDAITKKLNELTDKVKTNLLEEIKKA